MCSRDWRHEIKLLSDEPPWTMSNNTCNSSTELHDLSSFSWRLIERVNDNDSQFFCRILHWIAMGIFKVRNWTWPYLRCQILSSNLLCKVNFFPRQNSLFQNTKENLGGKKFTLQMNEVQILYILVALNIPIQEDCVGIHRHKNSFGQFNKNFLRPSKSRLIVF